MFVPIQLLSPAAAVFSPVWSAFVVLSEALRGFFYILAQLVLPRCCRRRISAARQRISQSVVCTMWNRMRLSVRDRLRYHDMPPLIDSRGAIPGASDSSPGRISKADLQSHLADSARDIVGNAANQSLTMASSCSKDLDDIYPSNAQAGSELPADIRGGLLDIDKDKLRGLPVGQVLHALFARQPGAALQICERRGLLSPDPLPPTWLVAHPSRGVVPAASLTARAGSHDNHCDPGDGTQSKLPTNTDQNGYNDDDSSIARSSSVFSGGGTGAGAQPIRLDGERAQRENALSVTTSSQSVALPSMSPIARLPFGTDFYGRNSQCGTQAKSPQRSPLSGNMVKATGGSKKRR